MYHCKIYDTDGNEKMDFQMKHFMERMVNKNATLSCAFGIDGQWTDETINRFSPVSDILIGKIQFLNNEDILAEYTTYKTIQGISADYFFDEENKIESVEGIVLFSKSEQI